MKCAKSFLIFNLKKNRINRRVKILFSLIITIKSHNKRMSDTIILSENTINDIIIKREYIFGELSKKSRHIGVNIVRNWVNQLINLILHEKINSTNCYPQPPANSKYKNINNINIQNDKLFGYNKNEENDCLLIENIKENNTQINEEKEIS